MKRLQQLIFPALFTVILGLFVGRGLLNQGDYSVNAGTVETAPIQQSVAYTDGAPNTVAAMFYSAWCSSCQILEPRIRDVAPLFEGRAVEFTKFNFTTGPNEALRARAEALGIESVYAAYKGTTGHMLLIDRRNQSIIAQITIGDSKADITASIEEAIDLASKPLEG